MNQIQFEEESSFRRRRAVAGPDSALSKFIIKFSLGLIKTEAGVRLVEISVVIVAILFILFNVFSNDEITIKQPSSELINSPQPIL